jgi:hypothetical protein
LGKQWVSTASEEWAKKPLFGNAPVWELAGRALHAAVVQDAAECASATRGIAAHFVIGHQLPS